LTGGKRVRTFISVIVLLSAVAAQAQVTPAAERRIVINMDEDVVEGAVLTAPIRVTGARTDPKHKSLIQLRKDFRREVLASGSHL
jgi:hypothetical protein